MQFFWQGKAQNPSPILRCTLLARRSAKLIANFSATMVTSLPPFLSLSLCISLSHRMYLTHNIGSASALPIIQRERKRDRRKWRHHCRAKILAMSLHFPMPKIRTFRFSPSHFLSHHCGAEIRCSHFPLQKNSPSLFRLSLEWRELRDEWSKSQDKWSNSAQSYCSSHRKNESN